MADTEINLAQLKEYKTGEYQLIDIRNEDAMEVSGEQSICRSRRFF